MNSPTPFHKNSQPLRGRTAQNAALPSGGDPVNHLIQGSRSLPLKNNQIDLFFFVFQRIIGDVEVGADGLDIIVFV